MNFILFTIFQKISSLFSNGICPSLASAPTRPSASKESTARVKISQNSVRISKKERKHFPAWSPTPFHVSFLMPYGPALIPQVAVAGVLDAASGTTALCQMNYSEGASAQGSGFDCPEGEMSAGSRSSQDDPVVRWKTR